MNQKTIRRPLLIALGFLGILLIIRMLFGSSGREGFIVIEDLKLSQLKQARIEVERPVKIQVEAQGSFEKAGVLAAYGWILREGDRSVVWQMNASNTQSGRGTLATSNSTILLPKGRYRVYFTTYGDPLLPVESKSWWQNLWGDEARSWHADENKWFMTLKLANETESTAVRVLNAPNSYIEPIRESDAYLWDHSMAPPFDQKTFQFQVLNPIQLGISTIADLGGVDPDTVGIRNTTDNSWVWRLDSTNSTPAGGSVRNRKFENVVTLQPGIYEGYYRPAYDHGYDNWAGNPPLDPMGWGIRLGVKPEYASSVRAFDIWDQNRVVEITKAGDSARLSQAFSLPERTPLMVYCMGEVDNNEFYDYGWIENAKTGAKVWEMKKASLQSAGGGYKNQFAQQRIILDAGEYRAYFVSDDSHSYNNWNVDAPNSPEHWGLTIMTLLPNAKFSANPNLSSETTAHIGEGLLVDLTKIGNLANEETTLFVEQETEQIHIRALGEYMGYWSDHAWITDEAGTVVWEMVQEKTTPAGGAAKNRLFDGVITLKQGTYTVHYKTDASHAYGNFTQAPDTPDDWGIRIWRETP